MFILIRHVFGERTLGERSMRQPMNVESKIIFSSRWAGCCTEQVLIVNKAHIATTVENTFTWNVKLQLRVKFDYFKNEIRIIVADFGLKVSNEIEMCYSLLSFDV